MNLKAVVITVFCFLILPFDLISQNKYSVLINQPDKVEQPIITSVSVTKENKNLINWQQVPNENIEFFKIFRDATNINEGWTLIANIPYTGEYKFVDISSFPNFRSYQYRISVVDKCGNELFNSRNHKTIKLEFDETRENAYLLKWSEYEGFDVDRYNIFKGEEGDSLHLIRSVPSTTTSIVDYENANEYTNVLYQAEAVAKPLTIKSATSGGSSRSNIISTKLALYLSDSARANELQIYPNPIIISALVIFPYDAKQPSTLTIFNLSGQPVLLGTVYSGEFELERRNLKDGLYILQIAGSTVYRKKIMIGGGYSK